MIRALLVFAIATAAAGPVRGQKVSAEPSLTAGTWHFTLDAGGAAFSDFQRAMAQQVTGGPGSARFERRVSPGTSSTVGGSVARWVTRGAAVRAAVAYAPSRLSAWNEPSGQRVLDANGNGAADPGAKLGVWLASGSLLFRLPVQLGRVIPYGIAGAGVVHYRVADTAALPPEARARFADGTWTGPAAVFGIGTTLPLQRNNMLLSFELTNHLVRTPLNDDGGGEQFEVSGVPLQISHDTRRSPDAISVASNLRLTMGLTIPMRGRKVEPAFAP